MVVRHRDGSLEKNLIPFAVGLSTKADVKIMLTLFREALCLCSSAIQCIFYCAFPRNGPIFLLISAAFVEIINLTLFVILFIGGSGQLQTRGSVKAGLH